MDQDSGEGRKDQGILVGGKGMMANEIILVVFFVALLLGCASLIEIVTMIQDLKDKNNKNDKQE